jgi:hypothetical protein
VQGGNHEHKKLLTFMVAVALFATTAPAQADIAPVETPGEPPQALAEEPWAERPADLPEPSMPTEVHRFSDDPLAEAPAGAPTAQGTLVNGLAAEAFVGVTSGALLGDVEAVAAGENHSCALLSGGAVRCWGANGSGQLGNGTTTDFPAAMPVVGLGGTATAIAAGWLHTCALLNNGTVRCWGANGYGQLGDGTMTRRTTPVTVSLPITATAIAAGGEHTCALLNDGTARCWGYNFYGQLGNGEFAFMTTPSPVRIAASTFLPILRRP